MPLYEYRCDECGHVFDDLRGFNDPNPEACPKCEASAVTKLITGGNFQLKGGGWYVTDYGKSSGSTGPETPKSGEGDGASSGDSPDASPADGGGDKGSSSASSDTEVA